MNVREIVEKLPNPEEYYDNGYSPSTKLYLDGYKVLSHEYRTGKVGYPEYRKQYDILLAEETQKELGFTIEEIEQVGGEGQGDSFHIVLLIQLPIESFPNDKIYLRANAGYQSYHGVSNWDESWYQVKPTKVTYTEYL